MNNALDCGAINQLQYDVLANEGIAGGVRISHGLDIGLGYL